MANWNPGQEEHFLLDFETRYLAHWPQLAAFTRELCGDKCCFPGCPNDGTEVHHAFYLGKDGSAVRLEPGVHLFYLCDDHHKNRNHPNCAHNFRNWEPAKKPPGWSAHQKKHYYCLLLRGWQEKRLQKLGVTHEKA